MKALPDGTIVIEDGTNYGGAVACSEDRRKLHLDLWVLQGESWCTVSGSGVTLDRASALKLVPVLQAFLAPAPEQR